MNHRPFPPRAFVIGAALVFGLCTRMKAEEILWQEDFESYASTADLLDVSLGGWTSDGSDGGCLPPLLREASGRQFIELSKDPRTARLRNGFLSHPIPGLAETNRIRLKFQMLHGTEKTGQYVGLFNAERTRGYAICWTAGPAPTSGVVRVMRFDASEPVVWSDLGQEIGVVKNADVTHLAQEMPLAEFEVVFDLESGEIALAMDGQDKLSVKDPAPIRELSQIVLRGNAGGLFDDFSVATD